ncbi:unnamed protein product [Caenorhabditis auriculariae]|uniref:G-protein coupled receptors family 1 profile domain-containing protein n=1 Tax=Caenorhabditis auriculariae TaxID=2777116 RepID=A0A8S1HI58_9PELO|nr:unnamed protein product [Caenorhabditis auriculariae]
MSSCSRLILPHSTSPRLNLYLARKFQLSSNHSGRCASSSIVRSVFCVSTATRWSSWLFCISDDFALPPTSLILNLAVADVLISVVCIPFSYWQVLIFDDQRWLFGSTLCSLLAFLQAMAVFLSAWTLVVISFDRWIAIMFVLSPNVRLTRRRALYLVGITWAFSIMMAFPLFLTTKTMELDGVTNCGEDWTTFGEAGEQMRKVYSSMVLVLQYIVPQTVLIITYTHIGVKMWNSRVPGVQALGNQKVIVERHESVKKLVPMVILISALFALCWLPLLLLINVVPEIYPNINSWNYILYIWWFAHGLAMLHSIVNPVVYYLRNARFREGFCFFSAKILPCVTFTEFKLLNENNRSIRTRSRCSGTVNPADSSQSMPRGGDAENGGAREKRKRPSSCREIRPLIYRATALD